MQHRLARWRTPTVTVPRISESEPWPNQIGGVPRSVAKSIGLLGVAFLEAKPKKLLASPPSQQSPIVFNPTQRGDCDDF